MKRIMFLFLVIVFLSAVAFAHDPRTVAKDFSHTFALEGAGKLTLSYKSLHFNEVNFNNRKAPRALTAFNSLWKVIGKFDTDFDVVIAGVTVPKGSYTMGINFDAQDNFKLVLGHGGKDITIPLQFAMDGSPANYLTFDFRPENDTDTFAIEARYGKARVSAEAKVPYLAPHEHPGEAAPKPAEKKP